MKSAYELTSILVTAKGHPNFIQNSTCSGDEYINSGILCEK